MPTSPLLGADTVQAHTSPFEVGVICLLSSASLELCSLSGFSVLPLQKSSTLAREISSSSISFHKSRQTSLLSDAPAPCSVLLCAAQAFLPSHICQVCSLANAYHMPATVTGLCSSTRWYCSNKERHTRLKQMYQ